ncbi:MAG: flavodoxin-dependent (E)-4-hydroxy-3-methylbut-2-enyl-diphosphate synthase [Spirochaetales bacterium]|nr:flavodoxin-dependent (E)-4-hydroxy-3-methylbut-2-enyl-diphosphate synthase [Spirochaetales bacterium]
MPRPLNKPELKYPPSRAVRVKNVTIGGGSPVTVQTMWKKPLEAIDDALLAGIGALRAAGCDILRFAAPTLREAELLGELQSRLDFPLVADVHFDHRIALECLRRGVPKLRINPGNIGPAWKVREVLEAAKGAGAAVRVGVNAGSLRPALRREPDTVKAMLASAEEELDLLEKFAFSDTVFSFKSSSVETTVAVNRAFRKSHDHPLHVGVTEAGPLVPGLVKNSAALYALLSEGIGDTVRVSLSDEPRIEVEAGREILRAAGLSKRGVNLVSCPACGRSEFPVREFCERLAPRLAAFGKDVTVAVMGCPVNGPGEAAHADLGITGAGDRALIFKKGAIIRRELIEGALEAFLEELEKL